MIGVWLRSGGGMGVLRIGEVGEVKMDLGGEGL
jgi:hypothetical protein